MAETLVADWSWARPHLPTLRAAGYVGAIRYLSHDRSGKTLTRAELDEIHRAGLSVRLNWEQRGTEPAQGAPAGRADGAEAARQAAALGAPAGLPIYYSVDYDMQPGEYDACEAYLRAAREASGRPVGIYGSLALVDAMLDRGAASLGWQTVAWSYGRVSQKAHIYQRITTTTSWPNNGTIDENVILRPDGADWWPGGRVGPGPAHAPAPSLPPSEEDDMPACWTVNIPADGKEHPVAVPPPHAGAVPWGDVFVSLLAPQAGAKGIYVVAAVGTGVVPLAGHQPRIDLPPNKRVVAKLAPGTEGLMVSVPVKVGSSVSVMIEAAAR